MQYPKINSLYKREGWNFAKTGQKPNGKKLLIGDYACPQFESISRWSMSEKVDGTNVVITYIHEPAKHIAYTINYSGRTASSILPKELLEHLKNELPAQVVRRAFPHLYYIILFGEGYGRGIQKGDYYAPCKRFILFDAVVDGRWLDRDELRMVRQNINLSFELDMGNIWTKEDIFDFVKSKPTSRLAQLNGNLDATMEGIVARSHPLMYFPDGSPIMFKLKVKDL